MPLAASVVLPDGPATSTPIVLIHGAANNAGVWRFWQPALAQAGFASFALDLRGHGRSGQLPLGRTRMADYADDTAALVAQLARPPVLVGWSMGGLVAMMTAERYQAAACIGLAPSTPAREPRAAAAVREGEFGPEEYGITDLSAGSQPAMPDLDAEETQVALASLGRESRAARDERAAGVAVTSLTCPLLIVTGSADTQWPRTRYGDLHLPADFIDLPGASHWGLVLSRRAIAALLPQVTGWLSDHGVA